MDRLRIERTCPSSIPVRLAPHGDPVLVCRIAQSLWARMVGLLATPALPPGRGLLIPGCSSIHTFGMRFEIACAWIAEEGRVLRVDDPVRPWRIVRCRGAVCVLEAAIGLHQRLEAGDVIVADVTDVPAGKRRRARSCPSPGGGGGAITGPRRRRWTNRKAVALRHAAAIAVMSCGSTIGPPIAGASVADPIAATHGEHGSPAPARARRAHARSSPRCP